VGAVYFDAVAKTQVRRIKRIRGLKGVEP